jgi:hypothetical protein
MKEGKGKEGKKDEPNVGVATVDVSERDVSDLTTKVLEVLWVRRRTRKR